jgi:hypothetical protein
LQQSGIDVDRLEKISQQEAEQARKRHDRFREEAINRERVKALDLSAPHAEAAIVKDAGGTTIDTYATAILTPDRSWMEDIEGELGNPWIRPYSKRNLELYNDEPGSGGWGCAAYGGFPPTKGIVWYRFKPDRNGTWQVKPRIDFNGFYEYHANGHFFDCKSASVHINVDVLVYQYSRWRSDRAAFKLLEKGGRNVDEHDHFDHAYGFPLILQLRADWCWVKTRITLECKARGNGSWAELNFKSGSANYIRPWYMAATPL